jgi:hypothetical protein
LPRGRKPSVDEKNLSKGQLRKLTALRKSLGDQIAYRAFSEWLTSQPSGHIDADRNADRIAEALQPLIESGKLRISRGGYIVRRGRGRVIVEKPD